MPGSATLGDIARPLALCAHRVRWHRKGHFLASVRARCSRCKPCPRAPAELRAWTRAQPLKPPSLSSPVFQEASGPRWLQAEVEKGLPNFRLPPRNPVFGLLAVAGDMKYSLDNGASRDGNEVRDYVKVDA